MKKYLLVASLFLFGLTACGQKLNFGNVVNSVLSKKSLGEDEIGEGLKEALNVGINIGADRASVIDGYFKNPKIKIPFPPEFQKVEASLRKIGLGDQVDKFVLALNRGAENASQQAKPIFINAVKQLSIKDAINILKGEKDAATQFLRRTTSLQLMQAFEPLMVKSLDDTQATKYYNDIANVYNKIPFTSKISPDLKGYATQKAIDGMFVLIAEEEAKIRENPLARSTDLLKRVFGSKQ
jgi:hypothetical protein